VAMQVTENMLQANKKVDGLFSASDVMLDGVLQAAGDANRTGIKILSVDGSKKAVDHVEQGAIVGTMAQFPGKMGPIAVEKLGRRARRKEGRRQHPQGDRLRHYGLRQEQPGRSSQVGVLS